MTACILLPSPTGEGHKIQIVGGILRSCLNAADRKLTVLTSSSLKVGPDLASLTRCSPLLRPIDC